MTRVRAAALLAAPLLAALERATRRKDPALAINQRGDRL
jgi:hypothetical protein